MTQSLSTPHLTPPPGINFHCTGKAPIDVLVQALQQIARSLQDFDPYVPLLRFADWWQHDGTHYHVGTMDMHSLFALVESPRSLFTAMPGDDAVRIGIAPDDSSWYLRMYAAWTNDGWALAGDFDLTLPDRLAPHFRDRVLPSLNIPITEQDAEEWYRSIVCP